MIEPEKKSRYLENAPFVSIVDPDGGAWEVFESPFINVTYEGAIGSLILQPETGKPFNEARRLMTLAEIRYPMRLSQEDMQTLGMNGFALELAKRILRTKALRAKGLPILSATDAECKDYIKKLIPVIERTLDVKTEKAVQIASLLTDNPKGGSEASSLSDIANEWFKGQDLEADNKGESKAEKATKDALSKMLKALSDMENPGMSSDEWFSKLKFDTDNEIESKKFKPLPPRLTKAIPGYAPGLPWVIPEIVREPMGATKIAHARSIRPSDTGAVPRYMHRLVIDGMVFGHKRKSAGASVLIDCSGSMGVTQDQVLAIAKYFPAGIVAGYSGHKIRVLAEKGRVVLQAPPRWSCTNECDGPALEWLLRQSAPRIWISDGQVTTAGDSPHPSAPGHCAALCRWGNIKRINSTVEALNQIRLGSIQGEAA